MDEKQQEQHTTDVEFQNNDTTGDVRQQELPKVTYGKIVGFDRYIKFAQTVFFSMTLQASWEALCIGFAPGLSNGGPTSLVYGMLLAWIGCLAIFTSLAEMASFDPNVGAQYRWCARYAPPLLTPRFWGLLQGWITVFGWMFACAQPPFVNGTLIQGLIILTRPNYVPRRWHGTLLSWVMLALPLACNVWCRRILPPLETLLGITHLAFFPITVIVLAVTANHSSTEYVWATTTTDISGWTNPGVSWCIGLLTPAFTLVSFDGVLHMGNEVQDAPNKIPRGIILSVVSNGAMAFLMVITLLYTIGNPEAALTSPTGYPIIQIFYSATGSKAATVVLTAMQIWAGLGSSFGSLASVSRLTWAFARDHGLPLSSFFGQVHPKHRVPLHSLYLVAIITVLLSLITIGSTTAFYAILSLGTFALYLSYALPCLFIAMKKLRSERIQYGPFRLGRWGLPINLAAFVYCVFIMIWLPFPPFQPVTWVTMNYAGPIMGAVLVFAIADWCINGRKRFVLKSDVEEGE